MRLFWRLTAGFSLLFIVLALLPFALPLDESGTDPTSLADPQGRFIELEAGRVYLVEQGPAQGTPVVLVHGLFGGAHTWRQTLPALAENGYRAIAFDRLGAGLSDKPASADYSQAAQADQLVELLDALGIERAVLLGHSAGGGVVAHTALRHPQRVQGLAWAAPALLAGGPPPFVGSLLRLPSVERWARLATRAVFTPQRLSDSVSAFYADPSAADEATLSGYTRLLQTPAWEMGLVGLTRDSAANKLSEAQLAQVGQASAVHLLLWGELDATVPLAQSEGLLALWPAAQRVVLPGLGHQPMEEDAAAFNEALLAWLAQQG